MKNEKKPYRTPIRIIKAFLLGLISGMLLLEYARNRKRPVLSCCERPDNEVAEESEKLNNNSKEKQE